MTEAVRESVNEKLPAAADPAPAEETRKRRVRVQDVNVEVSYDERSEHSLGKRDFVTVTAVNTGLVPMAKQRVVVEENDYYREAQGEMDEVEAKGGKRAVTLELELQDDAEKDVRLLCKEFVVRLKGVPVEEVVRTEFGKFCSGVHV